MNVGFYPPTQHTEKQQCLRRDSPTHYSVQSSIESPGTCPKSRWLRVRVSASQTLLTREFRGIIMLGGINKQ
ncbi:hypothetical protein, partial [Microcoleus sp. S13_C5]|uniref:hypothetical protein n=1 Tax=Microcoleus sp. S13_C5 TaxID=3055411 RepID=UPI002FD31F66